MRVLHHTLNYPPDGNSTADLQGELGVELSRLGLEVTALTATPNANDDAEARAKQPLKRRWFGLLYTSTYQGVVVFHCAIPRKGSRVATRAADYLRFGVLSILAGLLVVPPYDVILVISPPLTIGLSAWMLSVLRRVPFVYVVQEIYPDIAVSLGVLRNQRIIRTMERLELFIYRRAAHIVVISEWFRQRLIAKGVPAEKLTVIPNFVDTEVVTPGSRISQFTKRHGLDEKFVVLYAGNIGLTQSLESVLEAARLLQDLPEVLFLFVGGGTRYDWLEEHLKHTAYCNVRLLPYQPRSLVPEMYAAADVALVPLKKGTARETFPSKIYTIMAAGRAVIAAADEDTELTWLMDRAHCGWAVPPDDATGIANAVRSAHGDRDALSSKAATGRRYVVAHHSRPAIAGQYANLLRQVASA